MACFTVTLVENNRLFLFNIAKLFLVNIAFKKSLCFKRLFDFNHVCSREP